MVNMKYLKSDTEYDIIFKKILEIGWTQDEEKAGGRETQRKE